MQLRLHRLRSPALFSLIDSIWKPDKINIKEVNSQDSANGGDLHRCSPSFCYSMLALHGEAECSILKHSPDEVSVYSPPIYESLVQQITNPHKKLETEK